MERRVESTTSQALPGTRLIDCRSSLFQSLDGIPLTYPKRLRYRLLHVAGRLTRHARQLTLHLPADWPWAGAIARAFKRLPTLPA